MIVAVVIAALIGFPASRPPHNLEKLRGVCVHLAIESEPIVPFSGNPVCKRASVNSSELNGRGAIEKLPEGVAALSFSDEVRALRNAVRLTVNSETFPVVSRQALLAIALGFGVSLGSVLGPLWILRWRHRRSSNGQRSD